MSPIYDTGQGAWVCHWFVNNKGAGVLLIETGNCDLPDTYDPAKGRCLNQCEADSNAPDGSQWDPTSESCQCPDGSTPVFGSDASYKCLSTPPDCSSDSPNFRGYAGDNAVCDMNEFCPDGHSGGIVGENWVCLSDSGCSAGETYINGSCIGPDDLTSDPTTDFGEKDTDGDLICT